MGPFDAIPSPMTSRPRTPSATLRPLALTLVLLAACSSSTSNPGDADAGPAPDSASLDAPAPPVDAPAPPVDAPAPPVDAPAPPVDAPAPPVDAPTLPVDAPVPSTDTPMPMTDAGAPACRVVFTATLPDTTRFVPTLVADEAGAVWATWFDRNGTVRGARVGDDAVHDAWVQPMARTRDIPTTLPFAGWWGGALRVGLRNAPGIVLASLGPTGSLLGPTQPLSERDAIRNGPWIVPTTTGRHVFWQEHPSTSGGPMRFLGLPLDNAAMALGAPREFPVMGLPSAIVWEGSAFVFAVPVGEAYWLQRLGPGGESLAQGSLPHVRRVLSASLSVQGDTLTVLMSDLYRVWHAALLRDLSRPAAWTQVLAFTQNTEWIAHARGPRHTLAVWHETRYSDSTSTLRVVRLGPDGRALESPLTIATGRTVGNFGDDVSVRADGDQDFVVGWRNEREGGAVEEARVARIRCE
jgi:hypothetical protein